MELVKASRNNAIPLNGEWKPFAPGYYAHQRGHVRSVMSGRLLRGGRSKAGYLTLMINRKSTAVHRIIAEAFIPNPDGKKCVNHKDGDKQNNHVANLEWVTYGENNSHAIRTGLKKPIHEAKGVIQMDMDGNEIARYHSSEHVPPQFRSGNVCHVCNGNRTSHGGYKWKFINN